MSRRFILLLLLAFAVTVALRGVRLNERPMHNDEGVNGVKFGDLWETGKYKYDPNEHHGPTLYYATVAVGKLSGAPDIDHYSDARLRFVTVLFGLGLVLLLPLLMDGISQEGVLWAALFTAVSPAFVFYSRYYIHESLLVFFTLLAFGAGWRYWRTRKLGWILLAGAGLGLMAATKETFPFTVAAAGIALGLNHTWNRLFDASGLPIKAAPLKLWHVAAAAGVCLVVAAILFASFFTNPSGLLDAFRTYEPWIHRAGGESPHVHPWHFYLHRLLWFHPARSPVWSEGLILVLALVAAWSGFARRHLGNASASFVRFLTGYTLLLTAFYSLLPYKTPWCLLNFWQGMIILAGVGASVLLRMAKSQFVRIPIATALLLGSAHLAWQAWELSATPEYAADPRNPYVYAQTSPDLLSALSQIKEIAEASPEGLDTIIKVVAPDGDYWPLPWYLRQFKKTGWWEKLPVDPYAPIMLVSASFHANLDENKTHLMPRYFALRPGVFFEVYVQVDVWTKYLEKHKTTRQSQ